jgi:hypothetical protein
MTKNIHESLSLPRGGGRDLAPPPSLFDEFQTLTQHSALTL